MKNGWLTLSVLVLVSAPLLAQGKRKDEDVQKDESELREEARKILGQITRGFEASASATTRAFRAYSRLENAGKVDPFVRYLVHQELLKSLKARDDERLAAAVKRLTESSEKSLVPGQILAMKTLLSQKFPATKEERGQWLEAMVRSRNPDLVRWASHLIVDSGWPKAIDSLLDVLREEELRGLPDPLLWNVITSDFYRAFGRSASSRGSDRIKAAWEEAGRKLEGKASYEIDDTGVTIGFVGDPISPHSVFLIDTSSSMRQKTSLKISGGGTAVGKPKKSKGPEEPKVEIVKKELVRALKSLRKGFLFNVLSYNAKVHPWRGGTAPKLQAVNDRSLSASIVFAKALETNSGTNIYDSSVMALNIGKLDTIYLLSDGVPSRGGSKDEIIKRVREMNYLRGLRIITYGFAPEGTGSSDEEFMRKLAREHWGWYRRLN